MVESLGIWGVRWIGELGDEDLDPKLLLWDMHRNIDHAAVPGGRTVVQFRFPDAPVRSRDWWIVITADDADVCDADPWPPGGSDGERQPAPHGRGLARRSGLVGRSQLRCD